MKKTLVGLSLVALAVGSVRGDAYSLNTFAMVKIMSEATNTLIAIPWSGYYTNGAAQVNLPTDHLVKPENLTEGDLLLDVRNQEEYAAWMLVTNVNDQGVVIGTWKPSATVSRPKDGLVGSSDQYGAHPIADTVSNAVVRGYGLWLVRQNPKKDGEILPFYLEGQYTNGPACVTITAEGGISTTNSVMVANPNCSQELDINDSAMKWGEKIVGSNKEDTIGVPNGTAGWTYCAWDDQNQQWYYSVMKEMVYTNKQGVVFSDVKVRKMSSCYDIKIPAGQGFWYNRRGEHPITIEFN